MLTSKSTFLKRILNYGDFSNSEFFDKNAFFGVFRGVEDDFGLGEGKFAIKLYEFLGESLNFLKISQYGQGKLFSKEPKYDMLYTILNPLAELYNLSSGSPAKFAQNS